MANKAPPKLSGLIKTGAVVSATPAQELPDIPGLVAREAVQPTPQPVAVQVETTQSEHGKGDQTLVRVGVHLVDPNPLAPREVYTSEMILNRAEDLRTQGQHDPIHIVPNPSVPGRFIICDGWTRVLACREHKVLDTLLAVVHTELGMQESGWFGYEQNEGRTQHCDLDRATFYEKLIAAGESAAEIARRAKHSKTMMSFYRAYKRLPEDVLDIVRMHPGKFGATEAYQLAKLYEKVGVRKTVFLANKYAGEDQTQRWLTNQVQALLNPNPHKAKAAGKTVRYTNGVYKQRGDSFELLITVSPDQREAFAQGLEDLLEMAAIEQAPAKDADENQVAPSVTSA